MSIINISNSRMQVALDSNGAIFDSIKMDGIEYLWQADAKYWGRKDCNLFPYVGRMTEGCYTYQGKKYPMNIHGFCRDREFEIAWQKEDEVCFVTRDSDDTREIYPFSFEFFVNYRLENNTIYKTCKVVNNSSVMMPFGLGSHPGFNVPMAGEGSFDDWYFEFAEAGKASGVDFDHSTNRVLGTVSPYELKDGKILPLSHAVFDDDAIVLTEVCRDVTLKSAKSAHSVRTRFPGMPFLGLWHFPKTDAPYVCIEPWVSLPSNTAYVEDIEKQENLIHLEPGETYENVLSFELT